MKKVCEHLKEFGCIKDICTCNTGSKQEIVEEAAEKLYPVILEDDGWDKNKQYRDEWIKGARWQAERMYSEEEIYIIWEAGREYWKISGKAIPFEELIKQFKKK